MVKRVAVNYIYRGSKPCEKAINNIFLRIFSFFITRKDDLAKMQKLK